MADEIRSNIPPLVNGVPIVNKDTGAPSPQFIRLWQQLFGNNDLAFTNIDELRQLIRQSEQRNEARIVESNNSGTFYRYVNSRISYRNAISALVNGDGKILFENNDKACAFYEYFAAVGTVDDGSLPNCPTPATSSGIDRVVFNDTNVIAAINKLRSNLSSGPDGFPPFLFKKLNHCLAEPLASLFTQLLSVGYVPDDWKKAIITPVLKKGASG